MEDNDGLGGNVCFTANWEDRPRMLEWLLDHGANIECRNQDMARRLLSAQLSRVAKRPCRSWSLAVLHGRRDASSLGQTTVVNGTPGDVVIRALFAAQVDSADARNEITLKRTGVVGL